MQGCQLVGTTPSCAIPASHWTLKAPETVCTDSASCPFEVAMVCERRDIPGGGPFLLVF